MAWKKKSSKFFPIYFLTRNSKWSNPYSNPKQVRLRPKPKEINIIRLHKVIILAPLLWIFTKAPFRRAGAIYTLLCHR